MSTNDENTSEIEDIKPEWNLILCTNLKIINEYVSKIEIKMDELSKCGVLKSESDWDQIDALSMEMPKLLTEGLKLYQSCNLRLDKLEIQKEKMKHVVKDILKSTYKIQLSNKNEVESAMLNNEIYENAVVQYNIQKNSVQLLDNITDQLKYINNVISTKYEGAKLRASLGY